MRRVTAVVAVAVPAVVFAAALAVAWDAYRFLTAPVALERPALVTVPAGTGFGQAMARLDRAGVFHADRQREYLTVYAWLRGVTGSIGSGEYRITPDMTPRELLAMMVAGRVHQYRLAVIEGWRFRELRAALAAHEAIDATLAGQPAAAVMRAIGAPGRKAEGRFLPDTYLFPRGTTDVEFLRRAYAAMERVLAAEWAQRASGLPLETPYEALILASIVEKETAVPEERARIAGVFVRRLRRGMRLQTDPTVIYGIEEFDGNLRRSDLLRDGPYNTYRRAGLPPTPIALPGRAAIRAALHPAAGDALYFVSRGDGSHAFSATYEQHARAVRKYQLRR